MSGGEHGAAVSFPLDGADGSVAEEQVGEESATSPCKKVESVEASQFNGPGCGSRFFFLAMVHSSLAFCFDLVFTGFGGW